MNARPLHAYTRGLATVLQAGTCVCANPAHRLAAVRAKTTCSVGSSDVEEDTLFGPGNERTRVTGRIGIAIIEEMP